MKSNEVQEGDVVVILDAATEENALRLECCSNKFNLDPSRPQCPRPAVWRGAGTGNFTDTWTWCDEHAPDPRWRGRVFPTKEEA